MGYAPILDHEKLGKHIYAVVLVKVTEEHGTKTRNQEDVAQDIHQLLGVEEVCVVTGSIDIVVRVRQSDIKHLNQFLLYKLRKVKGVAETQTLIVLSSR